MSGKICNFLRVEQITRENEMSGGRFGRPPVQAEICSLKPHKTRCVCDYKDKMETCPNFQAV